MYELTLLEDFSAAHRLPGTGGRCEALHGHNWKVEVRVAAERLNEVGMVIDFNELRSLTRQVLAELDHSFLNDHPFFRDRLPTAEHLARFIYQRLAGSMPADRGARLRRVRVWESEHTAASYEERTVF
ncbi:MAG: 6-carboxytetrahydropterin synthase QueD [bacterium]